VKIKKEMSLNIQTHPFIAHKKDIWVSLGCECEIEG
jgi:hypothetical protein